MIPGLNIEQNKVSFPKHVKLALMGGPEITILVTERLTAKTRSSER